MPIGRVTFKPKKRDPEKEVFDFYLSTEEQAKVEIESTSSFGSLLDIIDNLNRGFYAITGGIHEALKSFKYEDESLTKIGKDVLSSMWKGLTREEKHDTRDILRLIDPEGVKLVEKNTKLTFLGIEGDALSIPLFFTDVLADPLTYTGFGAPLRFAGKVFKYGGKATKAVTGRVKGLKYVADAVENTAKKFAEKAAPIFNQRYMWSKAPKPLHDLFDYFISVKDATAAGISKVGIKISTLAEKTGLVFKTAKMMTKKQSKQLGDFGHFANDMGMRTWDDVYARELGISVEDYANMGSIQDYMNELTELRIETEWISPGKIAKIDQMEVAFEASLKGLKTKTAKAITKQILTDKGFRKFANFIAISERDATIALGKARLDMVKGMRKEVRKDVLGRIRDSQKSLRSGIKMTMKNVDNDIKEAATYMDMFEKDFQAFMTSEASPAILGQIKGSLIMLRTKVDDLTKYQMVGQALKLGTTKSDKPMRSIVKAVKDLEYAVGREQLGTIGKTSKDLIKEVGGVLKLIKQEFKNFSKAKTFEIKSLRGKVGITQKLQKELMDIHKKNISQAVVDLKQIDNAYAVEVQLSNDLVKKASKMSKGMAKKYYRAFSKMAVVEATQKAVRKFKIVADDVYLKAMDDFGLPKELRDSAQVMRSVLDDYAVKLSQGEHPLLKGVSPLYFPRQIQKEFMEEVTNVIPKFGSARGFLRGRKFKTYKEYKDYIVAQGGKVENDSAVLIMDYMKKAEMAYARNNVQMAIMERLGLKKAKDIPVNLKKSIEYIYKDGHAIHDVPYMGWVFSGYGKLMNAVKASLTVINPAFWGRNVLGFNFLAMTTAGMKHGLNPMNAAHALRIKLKNKFKIKIGKNKYIDSEEIVDAAEKSGYWGGSWTRGDIASSANATLKRYGKFNPMRYMGEFFKLAMHTEDLGRYNALIANLKAGQAMPLALKNAKKAMFDYNLINSPMDKAMQSVFGFYTFSRRNLPRQLMTLMDDPKQFSITARVMGKVSNRERLSDEEIELLNGYEKSMFTIFGTAVDGVREFTTLGFFPVEEAYQTLNVIRSGDIREFGARANPLVKSFLDWYYSKDSFYKTDFGNFLGTRYNTIIPDPIQKALGLVKRKRAKYRGGDVVGTEDVLYGDINTIFLIRSFPITGRFINDVANLAQSIKEKKPSRGLLRYTTGIKTTEFDIEQRKKILEWKKKQALRKAAQEKGAKIFKGAYVPAEQKETGAGLLRRRIAQ